MPVREKNKINAEFCKAADTYIIRVLRFCTFFIMPDFLFENVVYLLSLFCMYCISILTRPRVFLPGAGEGSEAFLSSPQGLVQESLSLTLDLSSRVAVVCVAVL